MQDTLDTLKNKINEKIGDSKYFYVSNQLEHGMGLYGFIDNFRSACLEVDSFYYYLLERAKIPISFSREEDSSDAKNSADMLSLGRGFFWQIKDNYFQTFKIFPKFEKIVKENGGILMNTSAELNRKFEGKISQIKLFDQFYISTPKHFVGALGSFEFDKLQDELDDKFVLQFGRGHTGEGTSMVDSHGEFEELKEKFPKREVRISEFVNGDTFSANCCMTKYGIYVGGIYKQITGIPELTSKRGATVGGTWVHNLSEGQIENFESELEKFRKMLEKEGYKGMFGIDFMFDGDDIKVIEMNARQQMTVTFNSMLSTMREQIPMNLIHLTEFLDLDYEIDLEKYNSVSFENFEAGQLYARNTMDKNFEVTKGRDSGEYSWNEESNIWENVSIKLFINEIVPENAIFLSHRGKVAKPNEEIARIQVLDDLFGDGKIKKKYMDLLLT